MRKKGGGEKGRGVVDGLAMRGEGGGTNRRVAQGTVKREGGKISGLWYKKRRGRALRRVGRGEKKERFSTS